VTTLHLRPIPSSPWLEQFPELDASVLDLRGLIAPGDTIDRVSLNGTDLTLRCSGHDHPHLFAVAPMVPQQGGYLDIHLTPPAAPVKHPPTMARHTMVPVYGLQPRGGT
jgi:hypothetical protein